MLFSTDRTADASPGWSNNSTSVYARGHSRCSPSTRRAVTEKASSPTHFWLARNKRMCISTDINSSSSHPSSSEVYKRHPYTQVEGPCVQRWEGCRESGAS